MRVAEYLRIYNDLRGRIEDGSWPVGATLPSENQLAKQYQCSRPTVRKAISILAGNGLIDRCPGIGSTVIEFRADSVRPLTIAIDLAGINSSVSYLGKMLMAVSEALQAESGVLRALHPDEISRIQKGEVDGVIVASSPKLDETPENVLRLARQGIPVLMMNRFPREAEINFITVDYRLETFRLIRRLLKNGVRRIGVFGNSERQVGAVRLAGWRQAHEAESVPCPEELVFFRESFVPEKGSEGLRRALTEGRMEVLFVMHGSILPNAVQMILASGVPAPRLVCFDDVEEVCQEYGVPVSYIKMPLARMGRLAVQYLAGLREKRDLPPLRETVEASVVVQQNDFLI